MEVGQKYYHINMKIEHVAIWTRDLERLADFYVKYFNAARGDLYTNAAKGFTSRFLKFQSGARLEIMRMDSVPDTKNDPRAQFTGLIHLAISTGSAETVDALTARLKAFFF